MVIRSTQYLWKALDDYTMQASPDLNTIQCTSNAEVGCKFFYDITQWLLGISKLLVSCVPMWLFRSSFFMRLPLGAWGIMFSGCPSVCPSVGSLKYPLSTCTWVRWSIQPTVTVLWHVRPSVRPSISPCICRRTHGGNGLKFGMLMYLVHLQNW